MKTSRLLGTLALASLITACGNDGWLSQLNGAGGSNLTTQQQAIEGLADHYCTTCNHPEGGALEIFADVTPEAYSGGPLELALRIGNPGGVVDEAGNWTVDVLFQINDFDLFAALPAEAWLFSADRTMARVVLLSDGLPAGLYVVKGAIMVPVAEPPADAPAFTPGSGADDMETYEVPGEHEPDATPTPHEGDPTPTPTPGPDAPV